MSGILFFIFASCHLLTFTMAAFMFRINYFSCDLYFVFYLCQGNPISEQKTVTANMGDSVILEVTTSSGDFNWQKNGSLQNQWHNLPQVTLNQIELTDAGIYECNVAGDRESGKQAIIRLIVRGKHPKTLLSYFDNEHDVITRP